MIIVKMVKSCFINVENLSIRDEKGKPERGYEGEIKFNFQMLHCEFCKWRGYKEVLLLWHREKLKLIQEMETFLKLFDSFIQRNFM